MMRRLEHLSTKTWRFMGSHYMVTTTKGNFNQMKTACAARGMHLWYPNSQEEMRFVENEILCQLPKNYIGIPGWSDGKIVEYGIWIGVINRPNGNCLLADGVTKCPVENYKYGYPREGNKKCTLFWWREGSFHWGDVFCRYSFYGLCEKSTK